MEDVFPAEEDDIRSGECGGHNDMIGLFNRFGLLDSLCSRLVRRVSMLFTCLASTFPRCTACSRLFIAKK